ncbi:hypothetical protein [Amycolatopsis sp. RTGN1]|uniref:hypothetical protein n=1 Tax=Amycolatopsis ponsaeliensis TaxID=2992142 RepID=UPI00254EA0AE|nr:hypothetical protein [Amycolatopsis sp. RTGN1]
MRIMVGTGFTFVALVLCCLWGLGAFQLAVRGHPAGFGAAWPVALLWALLSLFVFVLATGGIAVLIAFGVDRGRPAIWITLAIAAVVIGLVTWGYVVATRTAMIHYDNTASPEHPQPSGR